MIERTQDAVRINAIANHPAVYSWVAGPARGAPIDAAGVVNDPNNIILLGEHGFACFKPVCPHAYEMHAAVLPPGRGRWAYRSAQEAIAWIWENTPAVVLVAALPRENKRAARMAERLGFLFHHTTPAIFPLLDAIVPLDVYALQIKGTA